MHTLSKIVLYAKIIQRYKFLSKPRARANTIVTTILPIPRFRYFRIFITFQTLKYCTLKHLSLRMKKRQQQSEITFNDIVLCAALD